MEHLVVPVVREIVVLTVGVAERSVRIQAEVVTDELFALRQGVHLVTQTAVALVVEIAIGIGIGLSDAVARVVIVVIHVLVVRLVVLARIRDHVVVGDQAAAGTDTGVELDDGVAGLGTLGGDEDDTVRTAVAVNGGSRSVLQDGHGLDVLRVDVGNGTLIRNTVNDDERGVGSRHGTDATDADGRRAGGRVTRAGNDLDTGGSSGEGVGDAGGQLFRDGFIVHDCGRSREGTLRGRTVGHDDGLIQDLRVVLKNDVDVGAAGHGDVLSLVSHTKHLQDTVCRNIQGERTCDVRHGINRAVALQNDVGTHDSFTGSVLHGTPHSDVLCGCRERQGQQYHGSEKNMNFFHKHESLVKHYIDAITLFHCIQIHK